MLPDHGVRPSAWGLIGGLVPLVVLVAAMNPLFNTEGATVLFAYGDGVPIPPRP